MTQKQRTKLQSRAWQLAREMQATAGHALHDIAAWDSTPESIAAAINRMPEKAAQVARHFNTALLDTIGQDIRDDSGETAGEARAAPSDTLLIDTPHGPMAPPSDAGEKPTPSCATCGTESPLSLDRSPDGQHYCATHYPPPHGTQCCYCNSEVRKDDFSRNGAGQYYCGFHDSHRTAEEPEPAGAPQARPVEEGGKDKGLAA